MDGIDETALIEMGAVEAGAVEGGPVRADTALRTWRNAERQLQAATATRSIRRPSDGSASDD